MLVLFPGSRFAGTKRRPGTGSTGFKQPLHVVTRGEHSGLDTDGSYVDITTPAYSFGDMLCGTFPRSLRVAGAYRPNNFVMFRYQLLAITIHNDDQVEIPHQARLHVADHLYQRAVPSGLRYGDMEMLVPLQKRVVTVFLSRVVFIACPVFHFLDLLGFARSAASPAIMGSRIDCTS